MSSKGPGCLSPGDFAASGRFRAETATPPFPPGFPAPNFTLKHVPVIELVPTGRLRSTLGSYNGARGAALFPLESSRLASPVLLLRPNS